MPKSVKKMEKKVEKKVLHKMKQPRAEKKTRPAKKNLRVQNELKPAPKSAGVAHTHAQSVITGLSVVDPFEAYQRGATPSLPFAAVNVPSVGFWTHNVYTFTDVLITTGAMAGGSYSQFIVAPSPTILVTKAVTFLDSTAGPNTFTYYSDPNSGSFNTNFDSMTVAVQGMRVRNLTANLYVAGEHFIYANAYGNNGSTYAGARSAKNVSVAETQKSSVASLSYIGNPRAAGLETSVCDYSFCSPNLALMSDELQCMTFRSYASNSSGIPPQQWELEVVTYYVAQPFMDSSQLFDLKADPVDVNLVTDTMQNAYDRVPRFSHTATDLDEYKADTLWGRFSGTVKKAGTLGISALAGLATASWESLWGRNKADAYLRVLMSIPPDQYPGFAKFLDESDTHAKAVSAARDGVRQATSAKRISQLLNGISTKELAQAIAEDEKADDWPPHYVDGGRMRSALPPSPTNSRASTAAVSRRF